MPVCLHLQCEQTEDWRLKRTSFFLYCIWGHLHCAAYIFLISYLLIKVKKSKMFVLLRHICVLWCDFLDFDVKMNPTIHKYGMEPTWWSSPVCIYSFLHQKLQMDFDFFSDIQATSVPFHSDSAPLHRWPRICSVKPGSSVTAPPFLIQLSPFRRCRLSLALAFHSEV